jgi:hypothetical protein
MNNLKSKFQVLPLSSDFLFLAPIEFENLIRLGHENVDGGYIVPSLLVKQADALLSFGIGTDWLFEEHWFNHNPCVIIHAYDHSTDVHAMDEYYQFKYEKFFHNNTVHFKNNIGPYDSLNVVAFDTAIKRIGKENIFIKMDIEGSEYEFITNIVAHSDSIIGMVAEFHYIYPRANTTQRQRFVDAIRNLQKKYNIIHVHGNNFGPVAEDNLPDTLEITFVRKDFCQSTKIKSKFYIDNLDRPNNSELKDFYMYIDNI